MCGIVGIASNRPIQDRSWINSGRAFLNHRGPDDSGEWWSDDGNVGFAHSRLSIIDLSKSGHQPMLDEERGLAIIFNGEIYNFMDLKERLTKHGYTFKSKSDTEVILAAFDFWGTECLLHLNGMFAFAIFDGRSKTVFLARDPAGQKPLFYHFKNGCLKFASELKGLLADDTLSKAISPVALDCYLSMGFIPGNRCILKDFNKLPPANAMIFDTKNGTSKVWQYWKTPEYVTNSNDFNSKKTELSLLDELEDLLEDAVGRSMVSDAPLGVLLSGGIDSSLVTAMAVRRAKNVRTFTVTFPGYGQMDEANHAKLIADHFGTEHLELIAEDDTADLIPKISQQFDEPIVDSSMIPTWILSRLVTKHCKVVIGGDAGDELFGGYNHYSRLLLLQKYFGSIPLFLRNMLVFSSQLMPFGSKFRNYLRCLDNSLYANLPMTANYFDPITRSKLMPKYSCSADAELIWRERVPPQQDIIQSATRMDFYNYLPEDILVKIDRASMAHSLEVRAPFLDMNLVEFAFSKIPSYLKVKTNNKKILLKKLSERVLPKKFDLKRKQGFSIPLNDWLKSGPYRDLFWDVLTDRDIIFDRNTVLKLLKRQDRGFNNGERLYALVQFELWRRNFRAYL